MCLLLRSLFLLGTPVRIPNQATSNKKGIMYLSELDLVAITIALVTSIALIITSATANARLIRERNYWRKVYHNYKFATEAEAMGKPYSWNPASNSWEYSEVHNEVF